MLEHPQLDLADKVVRTLGWPALLGVIVWAIRTYDKSVAQFKIMNEDTTETRRMVLETLGGITEIKTNHLSHLQDEVQKQTPLLTSMDKSLAVIAAKLDR